jgi:hypothetical protein
MKLAFKNKYSFGYSLKEVEIVVNMAAIELACQELKINFWQMSDFARKNAFDYMTELLYASYITACRIKYQKPKYGKEKAIIWNENMSATAKQEFSEKINVFVSGMVNPDMIKKKGQMKRAS